MRYAIITGAAAGIGRATTKLLCARGWFVGAFDVDGEALATLAADMANDRLFTHVLDVRDHAAWPTAVAAFSERSGGRLDALINNAGIIAVGAFSEVPLERAQRIVDVNIMGVFYAARACLPLLEATPNARIINVTSISALSGWPYSSLYSASKAAIYNLTEALAVELADRDIFVCDVVPSFIGTGLVGQQDDIAGLRRALQGTSIAFATPRKVALTILAATESRKIHHPVGRQARIYAIVARYLPRIAHALSVRLGRRFAREIGALPAADRNAPRLAEREPAD